MRCARALSASLLAAAAAAEEVSLPTSTPQGGEERIPATLLKPAGSGPFPAVVIMHDCSGLGPRSSGAPGRWARELVEHGYVVIMPDSFGTRGYPEGICTEASKGRLDVRPSRRARDARAAFAFLRTQPYVNRERIGLMGGSHGGSSTLATLNNPGNGFVAGVALYPRCSLFPQLKNSAPLLILIGERDDWTPARDCQPFAGGKVTVKVYPGVQHSFDSPRPERFIAERVNPSAASGRGATTGGNIEAWRDSIREVEAFFERYLKPG